MTRRAIESMIGASLLLLAAACVAGAVQIPADAPRARLANGQELFGVRQPVPAGVCPRCKSDSVDAYLGVRYAVPPIGELRWELPVRPSYSADIWNATVQGASCMQDAAPSRRRARGGPPPMLLSEDCLNVNVYTPPGASNGTARLLPVMVWIHGGAMVVGSAETPTNTGWRMASETNSIVLTFNYRLGMFGLIAFPNSTESGNFGLADQVALLEWVRDNIASFGGDKDRVTIFGQSAGGGSTCLHLASPRSTGLFAAAISESGFCEQASVIVYDKQSFATLTSGVLFSSTNCTTIECLRSLDANTLFNLATANYPTPLYPYIDGDYMPDLPLNRIRNGVFNRVPTIMGINLNEGNFAADRYAYVTNQADLEAFTANLFGPTVGAEVAATFPAETYGSYPLAAANVFLEMTITCSSIRSQRSFAEIGFPVLSYLFVKHPGFAPPGWPGAYHMAEIGYVFGTVDDYTFTAEEELLHTWMVAVWTQLHTHGDVGQNPWTDIFDADAQQQLNNWRPYSSPDFLALQWNDTLTTTTYDHFAPHCAMFDRILFQQTGLDYITRAPGSSLHADALEQNL